MMKRCFLWHLSSLFSKEEIESELGDRLYPNNSVNLLGALTLKRIADCDDRSNKDLQEIIKEKPNNYHHVYHYNDVYVHPHKYSDIHTHHYTHPFL
ncbi:hypothetical protein [Staphylococcus equorum]|uniref:hypothetical protein n=1 Tax=Staphylococcus equorum TaxID=246432 RepID=UPI0029821D43|nr:hypothetical protein [Staphylococcus equorum]MDW5472689.1 hypothetical protein [Staphylococcus equorum]